MEWSRYPQIPAARRSYICLLTHADRAPSSSLLLLHWRRRLCLQVNGAWPLIDHVWSRTAPLISTCSSLVCFAVPILKHVISCITRQAALSCPNIRCLFPLLPIAGPPLILSLFFPRRLSSYVFLPFFAASLSLHHSSHCGSCLGLDSSNTSRCCRHAASQLHSAHK